MATLKVLSSIDISCPATPSTTTSPTMHLQLVTSPTTQTASPPRSIQPFVHKTIAPSRTASDPWTYPLDLAAFSRERRAPVTMRRGSLARSWPPSSRRLCQLPTLPPASLSVRRRFRIRQPDLYRSLPVLPSSFLFHDSVLSAVHHPTCSITRQSWYAQRPVGESPSCPDHHRTLRDLGGPSTRRWRNTFTHVSYGGLIPIKLDTTLPTESVQPAGNSWISDPGTHRNNKVPPLSGTTAACPQPQDPLPTICINTRGPLANQKAVTNDAAYLYPPPSSVRPAYSSPAGNRPP
ncbi:hypothetical protein OE88DRAFT_652161 [Heliocybe sulcata]|uniref:Uncharacterized protein n=1 Tax=Heliocybe sulcata TaxID=5364 RepID=A0A5C3NFK7_9AGAM|nr:hypothetical protein OE88DRAFT_652161 [Heliocybe sulcata]